MRQVILTLLFLICCAQDVASQTRNRNRQSQAQQPASQPSPTPVDDRQAEIDNAAKAERERYEKERDAKEEAFKAEQLRQNGIIVKATFWMAVFAGINLLVAGVYAVFAYRTLKAVDKQAHHANEQVGITRNQLTAMDRERRVLHTHAGAMFATARFTKQMLNETHNLVIQNADAVTAMQGQLEVMREQSARMKETFVLANRASLSVHSIELNEAERVVLVKIHNTGNMPAEDISLFLKLVSFGPLEGIETGDPTQEIKSSSVRQDYGRTKLFRGNLPILLTFYLRADWTDNEFRNIEKGRDDLSLVGYVEYGDGFSGKPDKRTEFYFDYHPKIGTWTAGPPEHGDVLGWDDEDEN